MSAAAAPVEWMRERPIVDTHAHVYRAGMPVSPGGWIAPGAPRTVDDYLGVLDANGIAFGVIAAMSAFGDYNDYTLEALSRHKRLRGTGIATLETSLADLRHARARGMSGIRFMLLRAPMPDFAEYGWRRLLARLSDLGMHVHVLIEPERLQAFLDGVLGASDVPVVVDHFGFPDIAKGTGCEGFSAALRAVETGRVFVKMAAFHRMGATAAGYGAALMRHAGPERTMWGTDWPFLAAQGPHAYADALSGFAAAVPDPAQRRAVSETALRFYFFR